MVILPLKNKEKTYTETGREPYTHRGGGFSDLVVALFFDVPRWGVVGVMLVASLLKGITTRVPVYN